MTTRRAATVSLRPATDADREFFARVYASTREEELAGVAFTPEQKSAFLAQQFAAQDRHYATYVDTTVDVVVVDGMAAGRLIVGHWPGREHIADVALLPEFRGQGVGTTLLQRVIATAEEREVPATVQVERWNRAQALYRRLGFAPAGPDDGAVHRLLERPARRSAAI